MCSCGPNMAGYKEFTNNYSSYEEFSKDFQKLKDNATYTLFDANLECKSIEYRVTGICPCKAKFGIFFKDHKDNCKRLQCAEPSIYFEFESNSGLLVFGTKYINYQFCKDEISENWNEKEGTTIALYNQQKTNKTYLLSSADNKEILEFSLERYDESLLSYCLNTIRCDLINVLSH